MIDVITKILSKPGAVLGAFYVAVFCGTFQVASVVKQDLLDHALDGKAIPLAIYPSVLHRTFKDEVDLLAIRLVKAYGISSERAHKFSPWIIEAGAYNSVPTEWIASLIMTESSFRYSITSKSGAVGPAQVKPQYWADECKNIYQPKANVMCGAMVLSRYLKSTKGNFKRAMQMYNVGPSNAKIEVYSDAKNRYFDKITMHLAMINNQKVIFR